MKTQHPWGALALGLLIVCGTSAAGPLDPSAAGADPLQVEPRVPNAAGTPCVVTLFTNQQITNNTFGNIGSFTPPAACPGPWAKVKLILEFSGPRQGGEPAGAMRFLLGDPDFPEDQFASGALYLGSPQITDDIAVWRVERDLTDVSRIFQRARPGVFTAYFDNSNTSDGEVLQIIARSGRLVFYPSTTTTPAQRRADAVYALGNASESLGSASLRVVFPRNIQQAHLDISARAIGPTSGIQRSWWSCVPDSVIAAHPYLRNGFAIGNARANEVTPLQGCGGGSFREVEVSIDGQLAGLAPVFPCRGPAWRCCW